jgi:hypothetical protein
MLSLLGTSYITNEAPPYTLLTIHNLYDITKFLCIYQSPYCLSVDNAFFCYAYTKCIYIYIFQRNKTLINFNK